MSWGDHGTGIVRGKRWLYESGTRVPLIMRFPEKFRHLAPATPGSVGTRLVCFIDLAATMLSLAGLPVPGHMQGTPFLGREARQPREYVFFIRDRMDEAYDCIRSVRGTRFRYIRNFYPHIPYDQYNQYLYKERSAQAWHRLAGTLGGPPALFMRSEKPIEELFDTESDPEEIHDLASTPEYRSTLFEMRQRLNAWMLETRDLGLLDESEMLRRADGKPPMDLGRDPKFYDLQRILETANLPLEGEASVSELLTRLNDPDSAVRYWAAHGLAIVKPSAERAKAPLAAALNDPCPSVRVAAAHALCRLDCREQALAALEKELSGDDKYVRIRALNVLALQQKKAAILHERCHPYGPRKNMIYRNS